MPSAAPGSWTCSSATRCPGSAEKAKAAGLQDCRRKKGGPHVPRNPRAGGRDDRPRRLSGQGRRQRDQALDQRPAAGRQRHRYRRLGPGPGGLRDGEDRRARGHRDPGRRQADGQGVHRRAGRLPLHWSWLADHAKGTVRSDKWTLNLRDPPLKGEDMKFADEFRDPAAARALVNSITELAGDREYKFMEVCGGHTNTIYRHGLEHLLPPSIELVHGPGCPVCVIPMGRVDDAIWLAGRPDVIFTTFGDMMRVPGSDGSLLEARAHGCDVRFVYSPLDALKIAVDNPAKQVVYFAVGFETTAPSTAVTLTRARQLGVANFSVFCNHVTIVPPIKAILDSPDLRLSGFIGPGHVSTVVGNRPYRFVPEVYGKPIVVTGFGPLDILQSVYMLLAQLREGRCEVENQYSRVVRDEGNPAALALLAEVFELRAR